MGKKNNLFRILKEKLFGQEGTQSASQQPAASVDKKYSLTPALETTRRQPYFIQIGFDFGTSFSKCICRDVLHNKAWVHYSPRFAGQEMPFLIPSALVFSGGKLNLVEDQNIHYPANGLYHLKVALKNVALHEWESQELVSYSTAAGTTEVKKVADFVQSCAVYFLAGALGEVRHAIGQRMPGFGDMDKDYMAVNLAIPVADAQQPEVEAFYSGILHEAWCLADQISGHPSVELREIAKLRSEHSDASSEPNIRNACYIYPEVSANVQGFVRSRVSQPGIYLFTDTGASTVDQSVFIFRRIKDIERLLYLHAAVLPLGSSHIELRAFQELRASQQTCSTNLQSLLEELRNKKERGDAEDELDIAKKLISQELCDQTRSTLSSARRKLYISEQIKKIKLLFGGGGHCKFPYEIAVQSSFMSPLLTNKTPDIVGLPVPRDLELPEAGENWQPRLSVAYGLSFEQKELVRFIFPKEIQTPTPEELWLSKPQKSAPTKDEC